MARDRIARDLALCAVVAAVAIVAWLGGADWRESNVPSGLPSGYAPDSPGQTAAPTGTAQAVYVVLTEPGFLSPTARPTSKPAPTYAPMPACREGEATPGAVCLAPGPPTPTAMVETPIPFWPDAGTPVTDGSKYIWRRDA